MEIKDAMGMANHFLYCLSLRIFLKPEIVHALSNSDVFRPKNL